MRNAEIGFRISAKLLTLARVSPNVRVRVGLSCRCTVNAMMAHTHANSACQADRCGECPARLVCRCLKVTEEEITDALAVFGIATVKELRHHTGAGDGCTCCHDDLQDILDEHARTRSYSAADYSAAPICSVR